jgi:hypothetical protein
MFKPFAGMRRVFARSRRDVSPESAVRSVSPPFALCTRENLDRRGKESAAQADNDTPRPRAHKELANSYT